MDWKQGLLLNCSSQGNRRSNEVSRVMQVCPTKDIVLGQDNGYSLRFALADIGKAAKVRVDDRLWATPHQEE